MKNILLVVPCYSWTIRPEVEKAIDGLIVPEWYRMEQEIIKRKLIHVARNEAIKMTLVWWYDYLLFCDDDNAPKEDALKLLLEADKDVIGWIIKKRNWSGDLAIYDMKDDEDGFRDYVSFKEIPEVIGDVFQVKNIWTGFVLYKRRVLEQVYSKYDYCPFENKLCHYVPTIMWDRVELDRFIWSPLIRTENDGTLKVMRQMLSEDLLFHERIQKWRVPIYAHKKVTLDHYCEDWTFYSV